MSRIASIAVAVVLTLVACSSPARDGSGGRLGPGATTLCVSNLSEGVGTIRVWVDDFRTHTVSSGNRVCRAIRSSSAGVYLYAESVGGGMRGPVRYESQLQSGSVRCWDWVVRDALALRLVPCQER